MKTILITGANRGLGKGFVDYCLNRDFLVFAATRKPEDFDKSLLTNKNLHILKLDVSDDGSIEEAFRIVSGNINSLDYLINNAGINKDSATGNHKELVNKLDALNRAKLLDMFNINTISPVMLLKRFIPILNSGPSYVVNISSNRASFHDLMENTAGNYGYRASKVALNMMTFCTLYDLPKNIKTFAVAPGSVKTDMNPTGESSPVEQAQKILRITENWKETMNGKFLQYDGTFYPL